MPVYEFPILKDGTVVDVGPNNKNTQAGTDRVTFTFDNSVVPRTTVYCGVMTHNTKLKVKGASGDMLLPFVDCK